MSNNDWGSVLLPMIRKVMLSVLASEITSVQPMTGSNGQVFDMTYTVPKSFQIVDQVLAGLPPAPEGHIVIDANYDVSAWIQDQPIHMWKWHEDCKTPFGKNRFYISEKLYTMMALRWS